MKLSSLIDQLEANLAHKDQHNPEISASPVLWHIDHSLKVINNVCRELSSSNPADYAPVENKARAYVLGKKKIMRGFAEAPKTVRPPEVIDPNDIAPQLEKARKNIENIDTLKPGQFFPHFSLGHMNVEEAKLFLAIHTQHHLEIIGDIVG